MKHSIALASLVIMIAAALLTACNKTAPPPEAKVESAGEAMRNDNAAIAVRLAEQKAATDKAYDQERDRSERQQLVEGLAAVSQRFVAALAETGKTPRGQMADALKKLDAIKAEAATVATNDCTDKARTSLTAVMSDYIEGYTMFSKEEGKTSDATMQKLKQASNAWVGANSELNACR